MIPPASHGTRTEERAHVPAAPLLFPLSAASRAALRQYAGGLADWLSHRGSHAPVESVGHTLARRRSHLQHRAAVVASDREDLVTGLRLIASGGEGPEAVAGTLPAERGRGLVWVFSGHGSQWAGMGRELLASEPAFVTVIDSLEPVFLAEIGFSPRQVLTDGELDAVDRIQAMIFAVQMGLAGVWRSRGVTPDAVIGHSVGEIAAAVTCGALTPQDGARLICRRSRLLRRVAGKGGMAMAALPFAQAQERLRGRVDLVAAIFSSPVSTVISGDTAAIEDLVGQWQAEGIIMRRVASDVAFHSPHMDPLLAELAAAAADLSPARPGIPMYSTAAGDPRATPKADGTYWAANLRNPVRLAAAVQAAAQDGYRAFLEISAHPVVAHSIGETLSEHGFADTFVGSSLRRNRSENATLLAAAGAMHCHGLPLDWASLHPRGGLITLPQVAWQRRRHWRETTPRGGGEDRRHDVGSHTLLGSEVQVAGRSLRLWRTLLADNCRPYPGSHAIDGVEIVPAAVMINTFLAAAHGSGQASTLTGVSLKLPLTVAGRREIQVLRDEGGVRVAARALDEHSGGKDSGGMGSGGMGSGGKGSGDKGSGPGRPWLTHATATVAARPSAGLPESLTETGSRTEPADPGLVRRHLASVGVPTMAFDWTIEELSRDNGRLRARVLAQPPPSPGPPPTAAARATWAPALDAALSIAPAAFPGEAVLRMVAHVEEVHIAGEPPMAALVEVIVDPARDDSVDVLIADQSGRVLARLAGLRYAELDRDRLPAGGGGSRGSPPGLAQAAHLVSALAWRPLSLPAEPGSGLARSIVLIGPDAGALGAQLTAAGAACTAVSGPAELAEISAGRWASADVLLLPPSVQASDSTIATIAAVTDAAAHSAWLLTSTVQRLAALEATPRPRLWCVTTGVVESRRESHLAHSSLWGVGRIVSGEHPELWGGLIDLPAAGLGSSAGALLEILRAAPGEDVIALRDGAAAVARLARPAARPSGRPVECRSDGTYLITGGLGALGLAVARWLAERGAGCVVLACRPAVPGPRDLGRSVRRESPQADRRHPGRGGTRGDRADRVLRHRRRRAGRAGAVPCRPGAPPDPGRGARRRSAGQPADLGGG